MIISTREKEKSGKYGFHRLLRLLYIIALIFFINFLLFSHILGRDFYYNNSYSFNVKKFKRERVCSLLFPNLFNSTAKCSIQKPNVCRI